MDHPPRDICALILRQFAAPEEAFGLFRTNSYWRAAVAAHFGPELRGIYVGCIWKDMRYWVFVSWHMLHTIDDNLSDVHDAIVEERLRLERERYSGYKQDYWRKLRDKRVRALCRKQAHITGRQRAIGEAQEAFEEAYI